MIYRPIFARAWLQVTLVAWNVVNVTQGDYLMAFISGTAISLVWWTNARTAAHTEAQHGRWAYGLGAGCGTVTGMLLGQLL